jgi:putative uncharacterized protein (fragment)
MIKTYLVDDEQVIIDELLKIVDWEGNGYTVCGYANDSKTALKEIEKLRPMMIVCDISMNGMNGLQLISEVLKVYPEMGVIFLTAYDNFEYAVEAIRLHVAAYLMKPVQTKELVKVLKEFRQKCFRPLFDKFMGLALSGRADEAVIKSAEKACWEYGFIRAGKEYVFAVCGAEREVAQEPIAAYTENGRTLILMEKSDAPKEDISGTIFFGKPFRNENNFFRYAKEAVKRYEEARAAFNEETEVKAVLKQMLEDISVEYAEKISLQSYAVKYHYNTSYLSEQFKAYAGVNFIDYLVRTRFEKAKELMKDEKLSMNDVAMMVGYEDYSHFSKLFKKHEGYSPVEYRKNFC